MSREYFAARARAQSDVQISTATIIGLERARTIELITAKICFDHLETGKCDHAACYELTDLIHKVRTGAVK